MRISAPGAGWPRGSPKKSQVVNRAAAKPQQAAAGTKWNAFIDAGCASHMKKPTSRGWFPEGFRQVIRLRERNQPAKADRPNLLDRI